MTRNSSPYTGPLIPGIPGRNDQESARNLPDFCQESTRTDQESTRTGRESGRLAGIGCLLI